MFRARIETGDEFLDVGVLDVGSCWIAMSCSWTSLFCWKLEVESHGVDAVAVRIDLLELRHNSASVDLYTPSPAVERSESELREGNTENLRNH